MLKGQHMDMNTYQQMMDAWMEDCFGATIPAGQSKKVRCFRFLEEAIELVQALGCTQEDVQALSDYVFKRPVGDAIQEVGGVTVTLAALCVRHGIDWNIAATNELLRIQQPEVMAKIRAKQASKPNPEDGPLPGSAP